MSKAELSAPLPEGAIQKKLVTDEDHESEKKIADEQKQKEMEEKKQKRKEQRCEIVEKKKKGLRRIKKVEKLKQDQKEMWARLVGLNNNFAKMKEKKKKMKRKNSIFSRLHLFVCKLFLIKKSFLFEQK